MITSLPSPPSLGGEFSCHSSPSYRATSLCRFIWKMNLILSGYGENSNVKLRARMPRVVFKVSLQFHWWAYMDAWVLPEFKKKKEKHPWSPERQVKLKPSVSIPNEVRRPQLQNFPLRGLKGGYHGRITRAGELAKRKSMQTLRTNKYPEERASTYMPEAQREPVDSWC